MTTCVYCGGLLALEPNETSTETRCWCQYPTARVEDVKTPPPLTPKDSLSVEVEWLKGMFEEHQSLSLTSIDRLFEIVDELRKENANLDALSTDAFKKMLAYHIENGKLQKENDSIRQFNIEASRSMSEHAAKLHAQLRRKDEAIAEELNRARLGYEEDLVLGGNDANHFKWTIELLQRLAALADGKEGGK